MNNEENTNIVPDQQNDVVQPKVDEPINFTEEEEKFENTLTLANEPITEPVTNAPAEPLTPIEEAPVQGETLMPSIEQEVSTEPALVIEKNEVSTEPVQTQVQQEEPQVVQPVPTETTPEETTKKGNSKLIIIVIVILLLAVGGWFVFTQTDLFGKKDEKKEEEPKKEETVVEDPNIAKYEGIYKNDDTLVYIHKNSGNTITFTIDGPGLFQGDATVDKETATQKNSFSDKAKFKFNIADGGINIEIIDKEENEIYLIEEGFYGRVADYNKDEIYKYAVGDPTYLTSNYSGYFKSDDIEMQLFQTSDKEVEVKLVYKKNQDLPLFDETFEIVNDNKLVAKSFFDENEIKYEIEFGEKEFTLKCNKEVFGYDEEDAKLELTYKYDREITQEEILKECCRNY